MGASLLAVSSENQEQKDKQRKELIHRMVPPSLTATSVLRKALQVRAEFPKDRRVGSKVLETALSSQRLRRRKLGSGIRKRSSQFNPQNIGKKK